jgi:hypothetical protein
MQSGDMRAPRQMSHFWPSGLVGGGCEQDFSTTMHQAGTLGSSWMQLPSVTLKFLPFTLVQL